MKLHRGRLLDHVHLVVRDVAASHRFYAAILEVLGIAIERQTAGDFFQVDELFVSGTGHSATHALTGRHHLAFATRDQAIVDRAHAAALAAGGTDNGAPGPRSYHPGYYAGFLLDPDGNNIEIVFHGPARYSADSVEVEA